MVKINTTLRPIWFPWDLGCCLSFHPRLRLGRKLNNNLGPKEIIYRPRVVLYIIYRKPGLLWTVVQLWTVFIYPRYMSAKYGWSTSNLRHELDIPHESKLTLIRTWRKSYVSSRSCKRGKCVHIIVNSVAMGGRIQSIFFFRWKPERFPTT